MPDSVQVKDWMTEQVISVAPTLPIKSAHQITKDNGIRRLPVLNNGRLVGIVTIGDVREASPSDATSLSIWELNYLWAQLTVDKIMSHKVVTVTPATPIIDAAELMLHHRISGLPVVSPDGKLAGILTESDIFKMLVRSRNVAMIPVNKKS